jgi:plasmid stabilization system protein ParE
VTLPVIFSDDSLDDIDGIAEHYAQEQAWRAALDVPDRNYAAARKIGDWSKACAPGLSGEREKIMTDLPYRIVYTEDGQTVMILRIKHTSQQWPSG